MIPTLAEMMEALRQTALCQCGAIEDQDGFFKLAKEASRYAFLNEEEYKHCLRILKQLVR